MSRNFPDTNAVRLYQLQVMPEGKSWADTYLPAEPDVEGEVICILCA